MSNLRRYEPEQRPVFITCVTHNRQPVLLNWVLPLLESHRHIRDKGIMVSAWVVLPDHFHALINLNGNQLSSSVHSFKRKLGSRLYKRGYRGRLWQNRFWDHIIRDQDDLNRHIDYIHFNPVKHGMADSPVDWRWSSIHRWIDDRYYEPDWGRIEKEVGKGFGE